jgi:polar amino acid transport system substrate-binding protein
VAALAVAGAAGAGCSAPRDPEGTLERVQGGVMRVGVTESEPWVVLRPGAEPAGLEADLVRRLARRLGARVRWTEGSEADLVAALHEGRLDLVAGGFTRETPWQREAALTRPYHVSRLVVGFPAFADAPPTIAGQRISVERGTEAGALVERQGGIPVEVDDPLGAQGGRAVLDHLLDDLGLRERAELRRDEHVMLLRAGENAWLTRVERFLLARRAEVAELLGREEGR